MKYYEDKCSILYQDDAFNFMKRIPNNAVDVIVADPPYFLSNDGFSNSGGKFVSVNKGKWDKLPSKDIEKFYAEMLSQFQRILNKNGTAWIFGSMHNIYVIGYLLNRYDFKILNNITWQKSNPAPNLSRRMFTHSTETILWIKKKDGKQFFNYDLMRKLNGNKQMKDVWTTATINKSEKRFGNHPTQKPLSIIMRIIKASTTDGMIVLDPFIGAGTTAVAGKLCGVKVVGVDNSAGYLNIAVQRLKDYQNERIGKIKWI